MTTQLACALFKRCLEDDNDEAWYQFQRRYGRYLRRLVWRTVRQHHLGLLEHEVEELLQELFCRLLAGRSRGFVARSDRQLWAYLSQALFHLLVDRFRRSRLEKRFLASLRCRIDMAWLTAPFDEGALVATPEDDVLRREGRQELNTAADRAVRSDRRALELGALRMALLEGYSSREISQLTGGRLTPRRVDRLVYHLRKRVVAAGLGVIPRRFTSRHAARDPRQPAPGASRCRQK